MSKKPQFGPWLGFVNSGRFKQKGFEKNHPVIILSVSDGGYGPSCRVIGLYEWFNHAQQPKVQYVKASGVSVLWNDSLRDAQPALHWVENDKPMPQSDSWPHPEVLKTLLRMSHNWSSEWQERLMSCASSNSQAEMETHLIAQGYMKDQKAANEQVKFYGQVVRNTDKALLVCVGPNKEEHWFPKSQTEVIGYLTDRPEQYVMTTKAWQLKSKVGDGLCETFVKAQKAIDKHGTLRNPMGVGDDGEIKSPGLGI